MKFESKNICRSTNRGFPFLHTLSKQTPRKKLKVIN